MNLIESNTNINNHNHRHTHTHTQALSDTDTDTDTDNNTNEFQSLISDSDNDTNTIDNNSIPIQTEPSQSIPIITDIDPSSGEEKQCRICTLTAAEAPELGRFISPCRCKGSMKYVHSHCLSEWRTSAVNRSAFYKCNQCLYEYSFKRQLFSKWLLNEVTINLLTIIGFIILLIIFSYIGKLIEYSMIDSSNNTDPDNNIIESVTPIPITVVVWYSFILLEFQHFIYGLVLLGLIGFFLLIHSLAVGGILFQPYNNLRLFTGARTTVNGGNSKSGSIELIILGIIVCIGLLKCLKLIYSNIKYYCESGLKTANQLVENIHTD